MPDPAHSPARYVILWSLAAVACLGAVGLGGGADAKVAIADAAGVDAFGSGAVYAFMAAGALLTFVMCDYVRGGIWMLPGLWMILFSAGGVLHRAVVAAGGFTVRGFYLIAGVMTLAAMKRSSDGRRPVGGGRITIFAVGDGWGFGVGQFAMAGILYWKLERQHGG